MRVTKDDCEVLDRCRDKVYADSKMDEVKVKSINQIMGYDMDKDSYLVIGLKGGGDKVVVDVSGKLRYDEEHVEAMRDALKEVAGSINEMVFDAEMKKSGL